MATTCEDAVVDGTETDVDRGGSSCVACATARSCTVDNDCATGACRSGMCTATYGVGFSVSGVPGGSTLTLQNNGGDELSVAADGNYEFSDKVTGPYDVTIASQSTTPSGFVSSPYLTPSDAQNALVAYASHSWA